MTRASAVDIPLARQAALLARARALRAERDLPAEEEDVSPVVLRLAPAQEGIWLIEQLHPNAALHNHSEFFRLSGMLDTAALQRALDAVAARRPILRTNYRRCGASIVAVEQEGTFPLLRVEDDGPLVEVIDRHARAEIELPFDLAADWPARARLVRLGPGEWLLGLTMHHIAYDGHSNALVLEELGRLYRTATSGEPLDLAPVQPSYFALAERHRARLNAGRRDSARRFWRTYLHQCPSPENRAEQADLTAATLAFPVGEARSGLVARTAREAKATTFSVLLAAFHRALAQWQASEDLCIGTVATGRLDDEAERVVGLFSNLLPIRLACPTDTSPVRYIRRAFEELATVLEWQDVPLAQALTARDKRLPLPFFVTIGFTPDGGGSKLELPGLAVELVAGEVAQATFPLQLFVTGGPDGFAGEFIYRRALYDRHTVVGLRDALLEGLDRLTGAAASSRPDKSKSMPALSGRRRPLQAGSPLAEAGLLFPGRAEIAILRARGSERIDAGCAMPFAEALRPRLEADGAVLLRGCSTDDAGLAALVAAVAGSITPYDEGSSPRRSFGGGIYSSTEYPASLPISLHNEMSYAAHWPTHVVFQCREAACEGGQTPLVDTAAVLATLPAGLRERFERAGVRYYRRLRDGPGPGLSWHEVFECHDRAEVTARCHAERIEVHWAEDGALLTRQNRPATILDPRTGVRHWFNQADQWHPSNHPPALAAAIQSLKVEERPLDASFADGTPIPLAWLEEIRTVQDRLALTFDWQAADILLIDNVRLAHGRRPFRGKRDVRVVLGGTMRLSEVVSFPGQREAVECAS